MRFPSSKSIAARALILRHIYGNATEIRNLPVCDDTRELLRAVRQLEDYQPGATYNLGTGATSLRFFLALVASTPGFQGIIDCTPALRRRPLAPLLDALRAAGCRIDCLVEEGRAPVRVRGVQPDGTGVAVDTGMSSQFASALMLVGTLWKNPVNIPLSSAVSKPYLEMTARICRIFAERPAEFEIEPDWSAASYLYELALLMPGKRFAMPPLLNSSISLQGDSRCAEIFEKFGVSSKFEDDRLKYIEGDREKIEKLRDADAPFVLDMGDTPDLVPALAVALCGAGIRFRMENVAHLRLKESDRLESLREELAKLGFSITVNADSISWNGGRCPERLDSLDAHGDHRIAMSVGAYLLAIGKIKPIAGARHVEKSFPDFYSYIIQFKRQ